MVDPTNQGPDGPESQAAEPTLTGIPAEILERVAQCVHPRDLLALRLTCRDTASEGLRTYIRVHFSHRRVALCDEVSLERAIAVAEHATFGPALQKVSISWDEIVDVDPKTYEEKPHRQNFELLLSQLFARIKQNQKSAHGLEINICQDFDNLPAHLQERLASVQTRRMRLYAPPHLEKILITILDAVSRSQIHLTGFTMDDSTCHRDFLCENSSLAINDFTTDQLHMMSQVWQHLTTLKLKVQIEKEDDLDRKCSKNEEEDARGFLRLLSSIPTLANLDLEIDADWYEGEDEITIAEILFQQGFQGLKSLVLRGGIISLRALGDFAKENKSLEELMLRDLHYFEDPDKLGGMEDTELLIRCFAGVDNVKAEDVYWVGWTGR